MLYLQVRWLAAGAAIAGALSLAVLAGAALPLEKKYSVEGFDKLQWKVIPDSLAEMQKLDDGAWSLVNDGGETMLLLAPYDERDLAFTAEIAFPRGDNSRAVGVFVNYRYYEDVAWASYFLLLVYPDGRYTIGHSQNGHMVRQGRGKFKLRRREPHKVSLKLAKLNDRLFVVLNSYKTLIQVGIEPVSGGFGFLLGPQSRVKLSDFELSLFNEVDYPFRGLDVVDFFTSGNR
jgi:hypothetical protein